MINLLYTEIFKLKRSKLFFVSFLGATVVPIMMFFMFISMRARNPENILTFDQYFKQTDMFTLLLIGTLLFGLLATYIFNREYQEETLKNLLTIPVGRKSLIVSKLIIILGVILSLSLFSYVTSLLLGFLGHFEGLTIGVLLKWLKGYLFSGTLLFLLTPSVILITILFKNYIPTIGFTIVVSVIGIILINSDYSLVFPWTAPAMIAHFDLVESPAKFTIIHSWISLILTFLIPLTAAFLYFEKTDIH
ncbi:MAG: ABC transporter permease [Bacillota bacterium]